jgi:hypothetical protein
MRSSVRRPSVLKASRVPTPGKSTGSTSVRAGRVTIRPCRLKRAGRVYSSRTSMGEKTALNSNGQARSTGRPPTKQVKLSTRSSSAAMRPRTRLLHPGATPQSTMAIRPRSRASPSSRKGSSSKKEMSTTSLSASRTALRVAKPMNPGTAPTTRSWPRTARPTAAGSARSARSVLRPPASRRRRASGEASTTVTSKRGSPARSLAMALPTRPPPRTTIFMPVSSRRSAGEE